MERINWLRVIAGGLLAGVVINVCEAVVNGIALKNDWAAAMQALGRPAEYSTGGMAALLIWGFLVGVFAIWLYAAIRPRYGAGPKTAAVAGLSVWVLGYLLSALPAAATRLFPLRLLLIGIGVGLVEAVAGTVLGAWPYKEARTSGAAATAAQGG